MKSFAVKNGSHGTVGNTDIEEWVKELCFFLIDQKNRDVLHAPSVVLNTDKSGLPAVCFVSDGFEPENLKCVHSFAAKRRMLHVR